MAVKHEDTGWLEEANATVKDESDVCGRDNLESPESLCPWHLLVTEA
jgi:hypothetical protein